MFTGIIEELGRISSLQSLEHGMRLSVSCGLVTEGTRDGDSIAVNGVCLTALGVTPDGFFADVSPETLFRTTLGRLDTGSPVNLERALLPTGRLGGHNVQGHVDARGTFLSVVHQGDFHTVSIGYPPETARFLVHKGPVAVDGISLTIASLEDDRFDIAVIPKTWQMTNLSSLGPGDPVNIETDIFAKYVDRLTTFMPVRLV